MQDFKPAAGYCQHLLNHLDDPPDQSRQQQLLTLWREKFPQHLPYTNLMFFQSGRLVIFCHSPAIANRMRLEKNSIYGYLSGHLHTLSSIEIKVMPQNRQQIRRHRKKASLSNDSARQIEQTADNISHAPLKRALKRLAQKSASQKHD